MPLSVRGAGSPSDTMSPGMRNYLRTKWHLDPSSRLITTGMGRKLGLCSLLGGAGYPYVVGAEAYLHAKFHFDPPAFDNNTPTLQTDEQDRQRSDSIGRTRLWATIRKTVRPMLAVRCLSVLSVCL